MGWSRASSGSIMMGVHKSLWLKTYANDNVDDCLSIHSCYIQIEYVYIIYMFFWLATKVDDFQIRIFFSHFREIECPLCYVHICYEFIPSCPTTHTHIHSIYPIILSSAIKGKKKMSIQWSYKKNPFSFENIIVFKVWHFKRK